MARIPDSEIERLKVEVSLIRLVEESGVALTRRGDEHVGQCPFHKDDTPSLSVSASKNLFNCFGCNVGGGPIDWVMKRQNVSFRHAVELLRDGAPMVMGPEAAKVKHSGRRLASPVQLDTSDQVLLGQVIDYYHETLKGSAECQAYLRGRGLDGALIDRFRLGYANRTLGLRLPEKNRKAGAEIRERLVKLGLYRETGHEHFNGSLVVPVIDEAGVITEIYGRKIRSDLRPGTPLHMYLPGPHKGVWNIEGVAGCRGELILAESLIDAMTFWSAGYRNVTATYGANGFTEDHLSACLRYGVERVLIAFDRDEGGDAGAERVAEQVMEAGLGAYRILFPKGMDANLYAQRVGPPARSLGVLIRKAQWLGNGKPPPLISASDALMDAMPDTIVTELEALGLAAEPEPDPEPIPEPTLAAVLPPAPAPDPHESQSDQELVMLFGQEGGQRRYRVRGWKRPLNPESLKVNLLVSWAADDDGRFHVDTFDLYAAKARTAFAKLAGVELGEAEDIIKHDLGRVLLKLEALQDAELVTALTREERPRMSDSDRDAAYDFLKAPDLMDRIAADFAACGVVGEETNMLTAYLACVSRLLDRPLAIIIQSSSAAGKSSLMDAALALMPADAQVRYSAMTGQSLFYMGETDLKHRILAIAEEEGAQNASYALKLLQSDGSVTIASTGKDATTGQLVAQEYRVEGPVMLFLTTTAIDLDEELLNRCMVLSVDESREQTRAIHAAQRRRQTLEGLLADEDRSATLDLHRNAQMLLEPIRVVNPFADALTFLDDKTRTRRDHMKYLTLIQSITLLHQYQRSMHEVTHRGRAVRYIEVAHQDIALANRLASEVLGRTLDELPPQTRLLLDMILGWAAEECARLALRRGDLRFTRRQIRALTGWGDTQLKLHLARLAALEYLLIHRIKAGCAHEYELLYAGEGADGERFVMGLSDPAGGYDKERSGQRARRSASGRASGGMRSPRGRSASRMETPASAPPSDDPAPESPQTHDSGDDDAALSYPQAETPA